MKQTTLALMASFLLLTGCTSKEQDQQIKNFWQQQALSVVMKFVGNPSRFSIPSPRPTPSTEEEALLQEAPSSDKLKAYLFLNPSCPWCKKLKAENWMSQFRQKYQDQVELVEYDLSKKKHQDVFIQMLLKHNMRQVGTPVLFVGDQVISGYPFDGRVDKAIQQELAKRAPETAAPAEEKEPDVTPSAKPATAPKVSTHKSQKPYMQIVIEEPAKVVNTKLSAQDRQSIQQALESVQRSNSQTLQDIGNMFDNEVRGQAAAIISRTESLLKSKSNSSPDYKSYMAAQKMLLDAQEKKLNELMRKNAHKIRSIRG